MKLLLDTHVLIWVMTKPTALSRKALKVISDPRNAVYVSAASIAEIAVKSSLGRKGSLAFDGHMALKVCGEAGYEMLPITPRHAAGLSELPNIHGDPFDRLLVIQAMVEDMTLVTRDNHILRYPVTAIEA